VTAQKGDIGTQIVIDLGEDVSTASALKIVYRKPDGTVGEWTATLVNGGYGIAYVTATAADLDQVGRWKLQAKVTLSSWNGRSSIVEAFDVQPNL
jgi:hypothetical protein